MRIAIPGGSGHLGAFLAKALRERGDEVVIFSRRGEARWDGRNIELDGFDAVINLAGRSVDCRYSRAHLKEMMDSRVLSTRAVARKPPRIWLQMSTATIYAHTFGPPNDEHTGVIGGGEPGAPKLWDASIEIAKAWEREAIAPPTTRLVVMRSAMVMGNDRDGTFSILRRLGRFGLGGAAAGGRQFMSWIHERDFVRAVLFLLDREDLRGVFNLASPNPLPQRELMKPLNARVALPATKWMLEIGSFFLRTETELILKSRRVIPARLLEAGFQFDYPLWPAAAANLRSAGTALP